MGKRDSVSTTRARLAMNIGNDKNGNPSISDIEEMTINRRCLRFQERWKSRSTLTNPPIAASTLFVILTEKGREGKREGRHLRYPRPFFYGEPLRRSWGKSPGMKSDGLPQHGGVKRLQYLPAVCVEFGS